MYQIKLSPLAVKDLEDINSYISKVLKNSIAAKTTITKIITAYESLSDFSDVGIPVNKFLPKDFSIKTDYKFILANNYSIFYKIENTCVYIIRILYSKRDFIKILFN